MSRCVVLWEFKARASNVQIGYLLLATSLLTDTAANQGESEKCCHGDRVFLVQN